MRIAGHNVIAIVAAAAAFWIIGALWFALLFADAWQTGAGLSDAQIEGDNPAWMIVGGPAISLVTAIGLSIALRWGGLPEVGGALRRAALLWVGFGATYAAYQLVYWPDHSLLLYAVMGSYTLVGWLAAAAILAVLK